MERRELTARPLYEVRTIVPPWAKWILRFAWWVQDHGKPKLAKAIADRIPNLRYEAEIYYDSLQWELRNYGK